MKKEIQDISRLIAAKILGQKLTGEELDKLDEWIKMSPENRELFERVENLEDVRKIIELEKEDYGSRAVSMFVEKQNKFTKQKIKRHLYIWMGSVAAIVVAAMMVLFFYKSEEKPLEQEVRLSLNDIVPGKVEAVLTLAGGQTINITEELKREELKAKLDQDSTVGTGEAYHTLTVPRGGEYYYELADGTKVWLNSQSELRFPARFTGDKREIYMQGEIYIEVSCDTTRPFVVHTGENIVEVLGTKFNLMAYPDEKKVVTTLVEGCVAFYCMDECVYMATWGTGCVGLCRQEIK